MLVLPSTINWTELGAQEWKESLVLRYCIDPPDLPDHCDGCGVELSICHALDCEKYNLVTARHNKIRGRVANLAGKAFIPAHVRDDPKIFTGLAV